MAERYGLAPAERSDLNKSGAGNCPEILQLKKCDDIGDVAGTEGMSRGHMRFAVIGTLATKEQVERIHFPEDASIGEHEAVVIIPAEVLEAAARDYLDMRPPCDQLYSGPMGFMRTDVLREGDDIEYVLGVGFSEADVLIPGQDQAYAGSGN